MEKMLENYIELICKKGVNVQKEQMVYINSDLENSDFTLKVSKRLYELGAKDVYIEWSSDEVTKLNLAYKTKEDLKVIDNWIIKRKKHYYDNNSAFLNIYSKDPEGFKNVNKEKLMTYIKANSNAMEEFKEKTMNDENTWCVFCVPSLEWAKKVFPNSSNPIDDLWIAILKATKCDTLQPLEEWDEHIKKVEDFSERMTAMSFEELHFKNGRGTDLKVKLVDKHIWEGGGSKNKNLGNTFIPNIPTEESFTMPHKYGVNGKVYATKVLNYNGNLIEDFWIEFKEGKAVKWDARVGKDILSDLINTDDGSCYLGEVAIVDDTNPIAKLNILFYNTLIDENASCHLAFGNSYPTTISDAGMLTKEEKEEVGINQSTIHVDFMFGDETMNIVGINKEKTVKIMEKGNIVLK